MNDSLEDYLVDKILTVENGSFSYNDRTLTLLAHTLFCRVGSSGSQLRTKIFRVYVAFVVEKAKTVCIKCPSINDLVGTLPSLFLGPCMVLLVGVGPLFLCWLFLYLLQDSAE